MRRRDTIIVAVLVNAGLLMVLFATAMHSGSGGDKQEALAATPVQKAPSTVAVAPQEELFLGEELGLVFTPSEPEVVTQVAKAPTAPAPSSDERYVNVTVKKGDVLEKLARANETSVAAIMKANSLSSTNLKVGQLLRIPVKKGKAEQPAPTTQAHGEFYIVKEGDSPWLIATKNNLRVEDLLKLNDLDEQKARRLRPGDRLRIR